LVATGAVLYPRYSRWQRQRTYIDLLSANNGSETAKLTAAVRRDQQATLDAGYRACTWAKPQPAIDD
jgi:hypothetical protein